MVTMTTHPPTRPTLDRKAKLRIAAEKARTWTRRRDALIVKRHAEGASLRQIANECGLSHTAVAKILRRDI